MVTLKCETVPDSIPATPKSPPTRRVPSRGTPRVPAPLPLSLTHSCLGLFDKKALSVFNCVRELSQIPRSLCSALTALCATFSYFRWNRQRRRQVFFFPQHHSSKASVLWCSAFFMAQLSQPYMTTGKTITLPRWTFVSKVISLLFPMLSSLVIAFVPSSKHLLISWLQSPSAMNLGSLYRYLTVPW